MVQITSARVGSVSDKLWRPSKAPFWQALSATGVCRDNIINR